MRPEPGKIAALSGRSRMEFHPHRRIPHRFRGIASLRKDPGVRMLLSESGNPALIPARQTADRKFALALLGFRLVNVLMPVALVDGDDARNEIEMSELEPEDLGNPGAGRNARFIYKEKRILQAR